MADGVISKERKKEPRRVAVFRGSWCVLTVHCTTDTKFIISSCVANYQRTDEIPSIL